MWLIFRIKCIVEFSRVYEDLFSTRNCGNSSHLIDRLVLRLSGLFLSEIYTLYKPLSFDKYGYIRSQMFDESKQYFLHAKPIQSHNLLVIKLLSVLKEQVKDELSQITNANKIIRVDLIINCGLSN